MDKVCSSCGAHHECIIGNYYQPTCDCGDKKINKELTDFIYGDGRLDEKVVWGQSPFVPNKEYSRAEEESADGIIATASLFPRTRTDLGLYFIVAENESTNKIYTIDVHSNKEKIPASTLGYFISKAKTCTKINDLYINNQGFKNIYIVIKDRINLSKG